MAASAGCNIVGIWFCLRGADGRAKNGKGVLHKWMQLRLLFYSLCMTFAIVLFPVSVHLA